MPPCLRGSRNTTEAEKTLPGGLGALQTTFQVEGFVQAESGSDANQAKKKTAKKATQKEKAGQPKGCLKKGKALNAAADQPIPPINTSEDDTQEMPPQMRSRRTATPSIENTGIEEHDSSHRHGYPHHQQDPVPLRSTRVAIQELDENNEEHPFAASPLPPLSPHTLEGPEDAPPVSTPTRTIPTNVMSYQFVHFDPSRASSDESFPSVPGSPTSDIQSLPSSDSSGSESPSSVTDSSRNADDVWSFYIKEGESHVCKLCCAGNKRKKNSKDKMYSIKTSTTGL
ncbi:hypothetical protein ARMSODRAFT_1025167 [Armillaria solidipes]|uniref:Uncharacterized protein n=1 Tax=Armillaria solidipes TaxID=1076256 RepID=A0A2H3B7M3_9AGAR|nr:hypothetical protein ARMSODRAFT_1025167 [Armillaria solidipes]